MKTRLISLVLTCGSLMACHSLVTNDLPIHLYSTHDTLPLMADQTGWFHVKPFYHQQTFYLAGEQQFCPLTTEPLDIAKPIGMAPCDKAQPVQILFSTLTPHRLQLQQQGALWQLHLSQEVESPHLDQVEFTEMQTVTIGDMPTKTIDPTPVLSEQSIVTNTGCAIAQSGPITVNVSGQFVDGTQLKDYYSGKVETVKQGQVTFTPESYSGGLLLLAPLDHNGDEVIPTTIFASTYHVHLDRFYNGDHENDHSYGRQNSPQNPNSFYGGDLAGLTQKLDYLAELGITTIAIQAPFEQVHGWLPTTEQKGPVYPIDNKQILDFTTIDAHYGHAQDLRNLIALAHSLNIKVVFDVDVNHVGLATALDMAQYHFGAVQHPNYRDPSIWSEEASQQFRLDTNSHDWQAWWGNWIQTVEQPKLRLRANPKVQLPAYLKNKADSQVQPIADASLVDYLAQWLAYWPKEYGLDGMRLYGDLSAKQVTLINQASQSALRIWQANYIFQSENSGTFALTHPQTTTPFSKINPQCINQIDDFYQQLQLKPVVIADFNSSKNGSSDEQNRNWATWFLLSNQPITLSYGSELNRHMESAANALYPEISAMPWQRRNTQLQLHWQKLLQFRRQFPVVISGDHQLIQTTPYYAFTREDAQQKVMVVFAPQH